MFLLYLAVAALRSARNRGTVDAGSAPRRSLRRTFLLATLTNLANPKVILFYLAFFPQFIDPHAAWPITAQFLVLGLILIAVGLAVDATTGLASGALSDQLRRHPAVRSWLDREDQLLHWNAPALALAQSVNVRGGRPVMSATVG